MNTLSSCLPLTLLIHDKTIISKSPVHLFTQPPTYLIHDPFMPLMCIVTYRLKNEKAGLNMDQVWTRTRQI